MRVFLQARTKVNRGIVNTVRESPNMFFAYNNGLTAIASHIDTERLSDGTLGIRSVTNLQIVNGGQTTASILYAKDQNKADLSDIFVQMKLSVIEPEEVEEIVPRISRFANTQNRISEADFFSNHPFHVEIEKLSRRLSAPPKRGTLVPTKWFYERARGQYRDATAYGSAAERRRFTAEFPRSQVVNKTDLAKYSMTFECVPHLVSRGAQKCFLEFAEDISRIWEKYQDQFNEGYFRTVMAKAIVFRQTDRLIGRSDWYRADRGYKANIVTYTVAWLVYYLKVERRRALDLQAIWSRQELPEKLEAALVHVAHEVVIAIKDTPEDVRNVTEYAKRQQCWAIISKLEIPLPPNLGSSTISLDEARQREKNHIAMGRIHRQLDLERDLVALQPRIGEIRDFARTKRLLSPKSSTALDKAERLQLPMSTAETNALRYLFKTLEKKGLRLSVE